ncbi:MAG: hypothetical protein JSS02_27045, partial [Planctomycetes bacterium]|nr:hypothetical protein [Planctomycetota bacterium]
MDIKPVIIWGLACVALTGCQSYYPNGYGHYGPYSQFPTGTYIEQGNSSSGASGRGYPTPVNQKNSGTNRSDSGDEGDAKPVPKYNSPDGAPNSLGAPSQDDEDDGVNKRRKTGSLNSSGSGGELVLSEGAERSGRSMAAIEDDGFVTPVEFRDAAPVTADREPRRLKQKSVPSPYKKDPDGYAWLRGVVTRDAKSGLWRLTYSREPL